MSDTETTTEAEAEAPPAPEPDPVREALVEHLRGALGDAVVESVIERGDVWVRVDRSAWRQAGQVLKDHGYDYFCFLSGIDWLINPEFSSRYEQVYSAAGESGGEVEPEAPTGESEGPYLIGRVAGGDTRFQVFARLYNVETKVGITLKADLDDESPAVDSWVPVFRGADWHERETWEMFGFDFPGHPGLRHIYLPTEFEGFPLRKDFPLLARAVKPWPGLVDKEPVPGEDEEEES